MRLVILELFQAVQPAIVKASEMPFVAACAQWKWFEVHIMQGIQCTHVQLTHKLTILTPILKLVFDTSLPIPDVTDTCFSGIISQMELATRRLQF